MDLLGIFGFRHLPSFYFRGSSWWFSNSRSGSDLQNLAFPAWNAKSFALICDCQFFGVF
jgi:hypothetical protein